jgi:mannobiose 2-epimerase
LDAALHSTAQTLDRLALDARTELRRIIAWWAEKSGDRDGFVGEIDASGAPRPDAHRSVVLNTRLLWFFSMAHAHTGSPACLDLAWRAADYITAHFIDPRHGGLFWMVDAAGQPIDRRKQAYAQAFGIYAFATHFAASGERASLDNALALHDVLETRFRDTIGGGYWEARAEDFSPIADMRLSPRDLNAPKSMNAHLHALEAYAALYRVHRTTPIAVALEGALGLMIDRVLDSDACHLHLFFDREWRPLDRTVSFGHDIEASWLMCEAADALGGVAWRKRAREAALRLVKSTLDEAAGPNGELFEERHGDGRVSEKRVWWIEAEGLVGFLNAFALTGGARYLEACRRLWRFIQSHQIDRDGGEWRALSALDPPANPPEPQAGPWKCPYHTGRAMMEMERRASALARAATQQRELDVRT